MEITKRSQAGTLESNDVYVLLLPNENNAVEIQIKSIVMKQFGRQIHKVATLTLERCNITSCILVLEDKGALDCTIRARIESAVERSLC